MIPTLLAWLVIAVAVPLNWYVAWRLWRWPSQSRAAQRVLRERTAVAAHMALVVTIFAGVFLNNGMAEPILDVVATQILTRSAILSLVIPPLRWLLLYRKR